MRPPPLCPHCGRDLVGAASPCGRCERDIPRGAWTRWPRTAGIVLVRVLLAMIPTAITVFLVMGIVRVGRGDESQFPLAARVFIVVGGGLVVGFMGCVSALLWLADRWDYQGSDGSHAWVQTVAGRVFEAEGSSLRVMPRAASVSSQPCALDALRAHPGARDADAIAAAVLAAWSRGELLLAAEQRDVWRRAAHWPRAPRPDSPGLCAQASHREVLVSLGACALDDEAGPFERALIRALADVALDDVDPTASYRSPAARAQRAWVRLDDAVTAALRRVGDRADAPTQPSHAADPGAVLAACAAKEGDAFVEEVRGAARLAVATRAFVEVVA